MARSSLDNANSDKIMPSPTVPTTETGWERDNRTLFDSIAVDYDKVRWDYPRQLFEDIFEYVGPGKIKRALEIGAGTGKATTPFLIASFSVTAVEMSANMSALLWEKFRRNEAFNVVTSTFEDALLGAEYYDLVYAASAFHWVDAKIGCPKVRSILKKGGTFALFRNNFTTPDSGGLYDEVQAAYEKYYNSYYQKSEKPVKKSMEDFWKPSEIYKSFRFEGLEQYGFKDLCMKFYSETKSYKPEEYIALIDTFPDHIKLPEENKAALYKSVGEAITRHGGDYVVDNVFQLYMGRK